MSKKYSSKSFVELSFILIQGYTVGKYLIESQLSVIEFIFCALFDKYTYRL